jgi:hypothetical protein
MPVVRALRVSLLTGDMAYPLIRFGFGAGPKSRPAG